jgi:hypothetical protein
VLRILAHVVVGLGLLYYLVVFVVVVGLSADRPASGCPCGADSREYVGMATLCDPIHPPEPAG